MVQKKTPQTGSGDRFKTCVHNGDSFAGKGEWEKAISQYLEAISLNEKAKDVHEKLLKMYLNKGDKKGYTDALARFNAVKSGKPILQDKLLPEPLQTSAQECIKEEVIQEHFSLTQEPPEELQNIEKALPQILLEEHPEEAIEVEQEYLQQVVPEQLQQVSQEAVHGYLQDLLQEPAQEGVQEVLQELQQEPQLKPQQEPQQKLQQETQLVPQQKMHQESQINISPTHELIHDDGVKDFSNPSDEARVLEETLIREPDNMEVLERLNQLYTKGVKLSDSAVVAIYRKIYRMKI